jgi:putative ABC transport system ATP-binding protein
MIIETQSLKTLYRTQLVQTTALEAVNLTIEAGQFVSIMGPSGCGKSTLLHILGLIDTPSDGRYRFLGEDVSRYPESKRAAIRKRNIGFVFQSFNLIDELTVYENVELPLVYAKVPPRERKAKVDAVLERMDIAHRREHMPGQLSGGQQQRVAVARAVANQPNLILADEPTGNLDSEHGAEVMKILIKLH